MLNYRQIDEYRERKGITQEEIALLFISDCTKRHISKNYINQLLNGHKTISESIYIKIINILNNSSIHELAKEVKENERKKKQK